MEKNLDIQTSVLLAAVIIAGSVVYAAHSIGSGAVSPTGAAAAAALAPQAGAKVTVTDRKDAPKEGRGKLVVTEFSDFQCPYCGKFYTDTYKQIKEKYIDSGKITFVYRHLPLSFHPFAQKAAEAAECANRQGKFFEYHDALFETQTQDGSNLSVANLKKYAGDLGLNTATFNACLDNGEATAIVNADAAEAQKLGITGTPSFVIDGQKIVGAQPLSTFEQVIDAALK